MSDKLIAYMAHVDCALMQLKALHAHLSTFLEYEQSPAAPALGKAIIELREELRRC